MSTRQLDDWIEAYLSSYENTQPPDMFKLWTAIFCISACLQRKCRLVWGTETFYPNLYVVLVGPSASGKGTAMRPGLTMLQELNVKIAANSTTREALIRELRTTSDTNLNEQGIMEFHSSLVIFSKELSVFLGYNNVALMSDLTDWYDCDSRWHYSTKDKTLSDDVINVWVALFGATTPTMLRTTMPQDSIGLGLTSRIIFVYEPKIGKSVPIPFQTVEQEALIRPLGHDLEQILMIRGMFKYTRGFLSSYVDWRLENDANPPFHDERLDGYLGRRPQHILKLCTIMNASRTNDMMITERDLERAISILTMTEEKMPLVFSGLGKNPLGSTMHRVMGIVAGIKEASYEAIYTMVSNDVDSFGFDKILKSMEMSGYIRITIQGTKRIITRLDDRVPFV